jgi:L-alanine-DL-glutamate epimerase-like enolase superfamily enzyme
MTTSLRAEIEKWPLAKPFRITGYAFDVIDLLVVSLERDGYVGRGEAAGVYYLSDTPAAMFEQIESLRTTIESGVSREKLQEMLPPGGARNALDCAIWDLDAKSRRKAIWELTGIRPKAVTTAFTIGIEDTPESMAMSAKDASSYPKLKIKLNADRPVERVAAIRAARPDAELVVDANQGWTYEQLVDVSPRLAELGVKLIEQPLPRGADELLEGYASPLPLAADESCLHRGELDQAAKRYQVINIKLDKAGGLTESLLLAREARSKGLNLLVGNMLGTSLGMAPAFVVAQLCRYVDLDGPLLLTRDRSPGLSCDCGKIAVPDSRLWG